MRVPFRFGRVWALTIACLSFLYLAYVIAVTVALRSGALTKLTQGVDDLKVSVRGGYSLWPGRFVLSEADLAFKDYNIEVRVEARELRLKVAFLPFLSKTIQLDEFHATDARYKMLHRVHDGEKNRERLAAFPDTGFERSKVYDTKAEPYQVPTFTVRVENIQGNVLEAWILEYRALGDFWAEGGFEVGADVTVFPSRVTLKDGQIFVGEKKLAEHAECELGARIGPFPGKDEIMKVLGSTSGKIDCRLAVNDLSALDVYWPGSKWMLEGEAKIRTNLELTKGQLRSSSANLRATVNKLGVASATLAGEGALSLSADASGKSALAFEFNEAKQDPGLLDLKHMKSELQIAQPELTRMSLEAAQIHAEGAGVRDPTFFRQLAGDPKFPLIKVESAQWDLRYAAASSAKKGKFEVDSSGGVAAFPAQDSRVACDYQAAVRCAIEEKRASCGGSELKCTPFIFDPGADESGRVQAALRAEEFDLAESNFRSSWGIALSNPKDLLRATVARNVWTELGLALLPLGEVAVRARVNRKDQTIGGTIDAFQAGALSGRAGFVFADTFVSRWLVDTPVARFAVNQSQTGTKVVPFVASDWDVLAFTH